ncbi:MAG: alpha/beta hydrolase, partial [Deltaproteobacteria bacterium]|nr:alpha/beta hydrolase [Deltaproteobacteria bacterium]
EWNRSREKLAHRLEAEGIEVLAADAPTETGREIMLQQNPVGLAHMVRKVVAQHDSWVMDNLGEIKVPTLVLVGENDTPFHAAASYMARTIPAAEYVVVPDAGHAANIDNTEAFNQVVLGFLKKLDLTQAEAR